MKHLFSLFRAINQANESLLRWTVFSGKFHAMMMLAPMAELSHRALRELIEGFFTKKKATDTEKIIYFTEMISAPGLLGGGSFEKWYIDNGPCPTRLVYQLLGAEEDMLVKAAALLDREECLGIDINMGCGAPAITRTGGGVRWMEDPDRAARLVELLRKTTKKQLSVKIRLGPKKSGFKNHSSPIKNTGNTAGPEPLPDFPYLLRFCRSLEDAGLDLIILHPRLAEEKFKRRARWEYIETLRSKLRIPVAGNGDIETMEELAGKALRGPVMAGRLLVRQPWVPAAVSAGETEGSAAGRLMTDTDWIIIDTEVKETGLRFLELLSKYQPPEFHLSRARRFFKYYCDNVTWAEYLRNKINREQNLYGIERVWRDYFSRSE